jgi:hypothetical protein
VIYLDILMLHFIELTIYTVDEQRNMQKWGAAAVIHSLHGRAVEVHSLQPPLSLLSQVRSSVTPLAITKNKRDGKAGQEHKILSLQPSLHHVNEGFTINLIPNFNISTV